MSFFLIVILLNDVFDIFEIILLFEVKLKLLFVGELIFFPLLSIKINSSLLSLISFLLKFWYIYLLIKLELYLSAFPLLKFILLLNSLAPSSCIYSIAAFKVTL